MVRHMPTRDRACDAPADWDVDRCVTGTSATTGRTVVDVLGDGATVVGGAVVTVVVVVATAVVTAAVTGAILRVAVVDDAGGRVVVGRRATTVVATGRVVAGSDCA